MLEIILCSLVTILPDYLYRRYRQGKRIGHEITLYSVWFELRFGIITCLMLTVALITMIFYYHPSTTSATLYYRTVPIIPETIGRVAEVHVDYSAPVKKGDVIFRLDNSKQEAALQTAKRKIAEDRCRRAGGAGGYPQSRRPAPGSQGRAAAGLRRTGRQARTAEAQSRHRPAARHRKTRSSCGGPAGNPRCGNGREAIRDDTGHARCYRPRRPAPRPPRPKRRSIWTRPSSGPASMDVSSSSCCGRGISSIP